MDVINQIQKALDKKADINFMDIQPGDVEKTIANIDYTRDKLNFEPKFLSKRVFQNLLNGTSPIIWKYRILFS